LCLRAALLPDIAILERADLQIDLNEGPDGAAVALQVATADLAVYGQGLLPAADVEVGAEFRRRTLDVCDQGTPRPLRPARSS